MAVASAVHPEMAVPSVQGSAPCPRKVVAHLGKAALGPGLLVAQMSAAYLGMGVAYLGKIGGSTSFRVKAKGE